MEEPTFREYEAARDAATTLLGCGGLSFLLSVAYFFRAISQGLGTTGWLGWYVGPATLLAAILTIVPGVLCWRKARVLRGSISTRKS